MEWKHQEIRQPYYHYQDLYRDGNEVLWLWQRGFCPYNLDEVQNKLILTKLSDFENEKRENDAACFFEDSNGGFWLD